MMNKIINFGEDVAGYNIPVLNEREIRAAAGILFLMMFISILVVVLKGDFLLLKYAILLKEINLAKLNLTTLILSLLRKLLKFLHLQVVFSPLFPIYWPLPPVQAHSVLKPEQQDRMRIKKRWKPVLRDCCKQLTSVCWKVSEGGRIWKTSLQKLLKRRRIGGGWIVLKNEPDDLFQPAQIIKLINHNTDIVSGLYLMQGGKYYATVKEWDETIAGLTDYSMEDVSFCLRAREKGFKILIDPEIIVGHEKRIVF